MPALSIVERAVDARKQRDAQEDSALILGRLWTVMGSYTKERGGSTRAFMLLCNRRAKSDEYAAFQIQHDAAFMFLDPQVILGTKLHARQMCCNLASTDELTIRVIA